MARELTINQRKAARLDAQGVAAQDIAEQVGVSVETISRWRRGGPYERHVQKLQRDADKDTIRELRKLRGLALRGVKGALGRALQSLSDPETRPETAVKVGEFALKVYAATSAQTGHAIEQKITLGGKVELIADRVQALPDDELQQVEQVIAKVLEDHGDSFDEDPDEGEE